jgi:hypothetical protein
MTSLASAVKSPTFRVVAKCYVCRKATTRLKGGPHHTTHTDVPVGSLASKVTVDVVVASGDRVVANLVVVHQQPQTAAAKRRAKAIARDALEQPVQIVAVSFGKAGSATTCTDVARVRCAKCVRSARKRKCRAQEVARQQAVRKCAFGWREATRRSKLANVLEQIAQMDQPERFAPCRKCSGLLEVYSDYETREVVATGVDVLTEAQVYHSECSPRCQVCWERPRFPQVCACERALQRQCVGCKAFVSKFRALQCKVPKSDECETGIEHVCAACATPCDTCKSAMSPGQHKKWSTCFACSMAARRRKATPKAKKKKKKKQSGGVCGCGADIDPAFTECYECKFGV